MSELTIEVLQKKVHELGHARWITDVCENCGQKQGYTFSAGLVYMHHGCKCDDVYQEPIQVSWATVLAEVESRNDIKTKEYWKL